MKRGAVLPWLSGALSLLLFIVMAVHSAPLSPSIPALQFTFDPAAFQAILAQWGPAGVARFRSHFAIDFPFLLSYGLSGYLWARHTTLFAGLGARSRQLLTWTLPGAALLDAGENLLHLYLLHLHLLATTSQPPALYLLAGLVASLKWSAIAAFAIGIFYAKIRQRQG